MSSQERKRSFPWILFAAVGVLWLLYGAIGLPLRMSRKSWREGHKWEAITRLERWQKLRMRPAEYSEILAAWYLATGKLELAKPQLDAIAGRPGSWFPIYPKDEAGAVLIGAGRYSEFLQYDTVVRHRNESESIQLYRAAAQAGLGRIPEAEATLAAVDRDDVTPAMYDSLKAAITRRKEGGYPLVVDSQGLTIAEYRVAARDLVAVNADFAPLVERSAGARTLEGAMETLGTGSVVQTTLDGDLQAAAMAALGSYRGAIVAIEPSTGKLLVVASSPGRGQLSNLALEAQHEPGSVVKVLTALAAQEKKIPASALFPLKCEGFDVIDGQQFFDWAPHGEVAGLDEALSTSCNVAFGRLGGLLGVEEMRSFMTSAGFGGDVNLVYSMVHLGDLVGEPKGKFDAANMAIGLRHERLTPLHLALIASTLANRGLWRDPILISGRRSILGEEVPLPRKYASRQLASKESAEAVIKAMQFVVDSPRGTGRRARIDGVAIAMKTGTAGQLDPGYDSLILAFAPVENPKIAIGVIAQYAGPAELAGTAIARSFLEKALAARAQQ